jgi:outer membrane protein assembly factor BamE
MRFLAIALLCSSLCACNFVYRIDVQQGNYLTEDAVLKLKKGMSKAEVRQTLGTPLLADAFHGNQWDYYFTNVHGGKSDDRKRFTVLFENDKVVSFSGTHQPPAAAPVGGPLPQRPDAPEPAATPAAPPAAKPPPPKPAIVR